jgi:hypothetical protein
MSLVDDDPEDVVNAMQASVWGGEFPLRFLIHVSNTTSRFDDGGGRGREEQRDSLNIFY